MQPVASTQAHGVMEAKPGRLGEVAVRAAPSAAEPSAWAEWFEGIYSDAHDDPARVPWADLQPHPMLLEWLNTDAPGIVRPGSAVTVVGCGLGDDAAELASRGYDVAAFDLSPTAIHWARRRFPHLADRFIVADLLQPPAELRRRGDVVVEIHTLQSVAPQMRSAMVGGLACLARPRGLVVAIARTCDAGAPVPAAPPFPIPREELLRLMESAGFRPSGEVEVRVDAGAARIRGVFKRT